MVSGAVTVFVDGVAVSVPAGASLLDATRAAGATVPTLCQADGLPAQVSCYLCTVEVDDAGTLAPACGTRAADGARIRTDSEQIRESRRTCLELLLSDHAGTCVGQCTVACPAQLDVATFLDAVEDDDPVTALSIVRSALALPAVLGQVCAGHCESACVRAEVDAPVSVRRLHGLLAEQDLADDKAALPSRATPSGRSVAVVGAGATGLSAAFYLLRQGHCCTVYDNKERPGGAMLDLVANGTLSDAVLTAEAGLIRRMGAVFVPGWRLADAAQLTELQTQHDAVILAVGPVVDPLWADAVGLPAGRRGVTADADARARLDGVFAAGRAVTRTGSTIRSVGAGRRAAESVGRWLTDPTPPSPPSPLLFRAKMTDGERETFFNVSCGSRAETIDSVPSAVAACEAARCMDCTCVVHDSCLLRRYSAEYGAKWKRAAGGRRMLQLDTSHQLVDYEPGKCILCGLCVAAAERAREQNKLGLTVVGRGFEARVEAPFGAPFADAIGDDLALECAQLCPSGAIATKRGVAP